MKILLVIDIQEKYLSFYNTDFVTRVNTRIREAHADGIPVFYVRNIGSNGDNDSYSFAKGLLIVSDHVYEKRFPSAFSNESFVDGLKTLDVTAIEVIGVDGNCCIKQTCLDAIDASYNVVLNLKCTAARNTKIFEKTLNELSDKGVVLLDYLSKKGYYYE